MNANHPRSEDEEEEPFTIGYDAERLSHSSSHSNIDQTSRLMSPKTELPADLQQVIILLDCLNFIDKYGFWKV